MSAENPRVLFIGPTTGPKYAQTAMASRFYGLELVAATAGDLASDWADSAPESSSPILIVVDASELPRQPLERWKELSDRALQNAVPLAIIGIDPKIELGALTVLTGRRSLAAAAVGPGAALSVCAPSPLSPGFALRGIRFELQSTAAFGLEIGDAPHLLVLATIGANESDERAALVRLDTGARPIYLSSALEGVPATDRSWEFARERFGELLPSLLLLRDAGGLRCWLAPLSAANLTIDDPWLTEPYGSLSYRGLLAEMRRERFHATIGFVPWNYDRCTDEAAALVRNNPDCFSVAVHGNNHDRYEFYRYESRVGDNQRAKPWAAQAFNIRQAVARMEDFRRRTRLEYDRVMVFPHGVSPAPTFALLKQNGFWATSNYSNVPLGESAPSDPSAALRAVNAAWHDFPALRRNYPQNLSEASIAIDLFLGNPVLFMAHQDLFFEGIGAFTPTARLVSQRQPAVRWLSLGEISRNVHLLRWPHSGLCEVRLFSRHARIDNPRDVPVEFRFEKSESDPAAVDRVTLDGTELSWAFGEGIVRFAATLAVGASGLVELHYHFPAESGGVDVRRRGFRNRCLRRIAEFRDLVLPRSVLGRLLTRKYYRQGKHRPTFRSFFSGRFGGASRRDTSRPKS